MYGLCGTAVSVIRGVQGLVHPYVPESRGTPEETMEASWAAEDKLQFSKGCSSRYGMFHDAFCLPVLQLRLPCHAAPYTKLYLNGTI